MPTPVELIAELKVHKRKGTFFSSLASQLSSDALKDITVSAALKYVEDADYENIKAIFSINPSLMFVDDPAKKISPLNYAIQRLDSYTWKICKKICEKYKQINPALLLFYKEQVFEDTTDLHLLLNAYCEYFVAFNQFTQGNESCNAVRDAWILVGKMQRPLLQKHMLKELCQKTGTDMLLVSYSHQEQLCFATLKAISEKHNRSPVLIKMGHKRYVYGFAEQRQWALNRILKEEWKSVETWQQVEYPGVGESVRKWPAKFIDTITEELINLKVHSPQWTVKSTFDADTFPQPAAMVIEKYPDQGEIPFSGNEAGWGETFTLVRGHNPVCRAMEDGTGWVVYEAWEDYKIINNLWQKRRSEAKQEFSAAAPHYSSAQIPSLPT